MERQMVTGRPEAVAVALKLLYITFGIAAVRSFTLVEIFLDTRTTAAGVAMSVMLFSLVIMCFCIYKTGKGRNWARIISLALAIICIPFSVFKNLQNLTVDPLKGLIPLRGFDPIFGMFGIGQAVFVTVAVVILFQKSSNDWFRDMKTV